MNFLQNIGFLEPYFTFSLRSRTLFICFKCVEVIWLRIYSLILSIDTFSFSVGLREDASLFSSRARRKFSKSKNILKIHNFSQNSLRKIIFSPNCSVKQGLHGYVHFKVIGYI
ncbi:hypothetical protein EGW08_000407 [Elysia chlorotica]|uniref:Uncharacterized protein n=1 Tax=Elysia chlorotica TaxID=188477 RepID=A0A3S1A1B0_ELYCH|nr:hypothetical protein EGW08_000407 [Elysia chlorotica]